MRQHIAKHIEQGSKIALSKRLSRAQIKTIDRKADERTTMTDRLSFIVDRAAELE
jgi:hypothetical protein